MLVVGGGVTSGSETLGAGLTSGSLTRGDGLTSGSGTVWTVFCFGRYSRTAFLIREETGGYWNTSQIKAKIIRRITDFYTSK